MKALLIASATVLASFAFVSEAAAFCRTTTCVCPPGTDAGTKNLAPTDSACPDSCPKDENGCQLKGNPVAWRGKCVGFSINLVGTTNLTPDQWDDAITQAFDAWSNVDCGDGQPPSINTMRLSNVSCQQYTKFDHSGPNVNGIFFEDNGWTGNKDIEGTLALTKVQFDPDGTILKADMAINSGQHDFTVDLNNVGEDLISIVTHEAGHFLGLDHSPNEDAVMYWTYSSGQVKRKLTDDDIKAICTLYPPDRATGTCDPVPPGGLLDTCSGTAKVGCSASGSDSSSTQWLLPFVVGAIGVAANRIRRMRKREDVRFGRP